MAAEIQVWDLPGQHWWATGSCRAWASGRLTSSKKPGVQTSVVMLSGHDGVLGRCSGLSVMSRYCNSHAEGQSASAALLGIVELGMVTARCTTP